MLLLHQIGSVKIGEVVRYHITYTPAHDRILPAPEHLYLRIRNTSSSALRAAFVHGPYTLYVDAYPAGFNPNEKLENPRHYGVPEFEPMLKAGGSWSCRLIVPESIRHDAGSGGADGSVQPPPSASWVINICSQVIFSTSAAVHYEVLLARDPKSLDAGSGITSGMPLILGGTGGATTGPEGQVLQPGRVSDYQRGRDGRHPDQPKGVYSRAIRMQVEDTAALWNKPRLPGWDGPAGLRVPDSSTTNIAVPVDTPAIRGSDSGSTRQAAPNKIKKVHLVVLTHGLHSNLGGDMLFLKESIDEAVKKAKVDRKARRARERAEAAAAGQEPSHESQETDDDDEEVVVRGYSGNATRTERGIKYLGKRLARYVLSMTYPDQPFFPYKAPVEPTVLRRRTTGMTETQQPRSPTMDSRPAHKKSTIRMMPTERQRAYKFTQISFISHSLGGLVQTYAVAYIQKHSPQFFDLIKPINFITLASPFLGLNHENPLYVKFALDFGLVGRTGQDLGLTWRPPTLARSGWGALVGGLGDSTQKKPDQPEPESKPLLRILPTGPAHTALKKFRNRTVYSNVVNDGIVPLRTSCLLFLDWQGLGRVEKARREAGLVESVVGFGWAELTGANVITPRKEDWDLDEAEDEDEEEKEAAVAAAVAKGEPEAVDHAATHDVPLPPSNATLEDDRQSLRATAAASGFHDDIDMVQQHDGPTGTTNGAGWLSTATTNNNPFSNFLNFLRGGESSTSPQPTPRSTSPTPTPTPPEGHTTNAHHHGSKQNKIYQRSQTLRMDAALSASPSSTSVASSQSAPAASKSCVTTGHELSQRGLEDGTASQVVAPPKTSFFESATDLLNPKMPTVEYLIDPARRPRTIFHDRVYHPSDIPAPPLKSRPSGALVAKRRLSFPLRTGGSGSGSGSASGSASWGETPVPTDATGPSRQDSILSSQDYDDMVHRSTGRGPDEVIDSASMRVEEKIARAYHRGMAWRKVLVKLEPDAHNNMLVRRTFANAFGWPVMKHLVDAHFSDAAAARLADDEEDSQERALPLQMGADAHGSEVREAAAAAGGDEETGAASDGDTTPKAEEVPGQTADEAIPALGAAEETAGKAKHESDTWSDNGWEESEESETEEEKGRERAEKAEKTEKAVDKTEASTAQTTAA